MVMGFFVVSSWPPNSCITSKSIFQDEKVSAGPSTEPTKKRVKLPGWVWLIIVVGIPTVFIVAGKLLGRSYVEIFVFMILCTFGAFMTYFLR